MKIKLADMIQTHEACIRALDETKHCGTCAIVAADFESAPCNNCYDQMLGLSVNPTNWQPQP